MAKHRLEQPSTGLKTARGAVIAGSITLGTVAMGAGPALAAPVTVPGIGTFEIPGITENQIPPQFKAKPKPNGPESSPDLFGRNGALGQRAASAALTRIGSPYVYGAAGPRAFDCSGLVYWSFKQAGKTIPRDSYGQLGGGRPVSESDLRPGDVVIFNGGSHAGLYIGNGMIVHSSTEGVPVQKASLKSMDFYAARRY
ncbi:C40 family peptidase [Williamsia herbipolensis]|uniref:NlpC/P60 family protein n=1 Tax=Williamsia herbipolensis TaxID=1603258 RepID=A0AAU4K4W3_9NOCA|nr:C40 family peptidase [Williamsia herbipolensis]MCX6470638.1 NlpC/P60 family protein [Mycobacteriales bacterium]